ncbi:MAG: hypothetical protein RIR70_251 [Pseudomonadota bacterium]
MDVSIWWLTYLALGLFVGFVAGLLGIGGGTVMVPVLAMIFTAQGFSQDHVLHLALGTSMATIIFTAISSARSHHLHGAVIWPVVRDITPGILLGTLLGTLVASRVSTRGMAIFFTVFVVLIALQMLANIKPKPSRGLPGRLGTSSVGLGIGMVSALVAIGGGALTVPFLTWCNVRVQDAIGTSAAVGFPIAVGGTVGYIWNGLHANSLPAASVGFIYLPALLFVMAASVTTAPLGARLAHRLPVATLKRIFAGVLILLSAKMLAGVWQG